MVVDFVTSGSEGPRDPECDCRAAEAPIQGRLQGPPLPGIADPAGGLLVSALFLELPRHRGAVPRTRPGAGPGAGPICCSRSAAPSTTARSAPVSGRNSCQPTTHTRQWRWPPDPQLFDGPASGYPDLGRWHGQPPIEFRCSAPQWDEKNALASGECRLNPDCASGRSITNERF